MFPEKSAVEVAEWVMAGGLLSSMIDLDVYALTLLKSGKERRLRPFVNPLEIYRKFCTFMDAITETGVLRTAMKSHLVSSALSILASHIFFKEYSIPVTLGAISHLISDIPNMQRTRRWGNANTDHH